MFNSLRNRYLRKRLGEPVIIVSGLPRSGTSMMMKMLDAAKMDLVTDELRTADEDNPKGYFEFEPVKQLEKAEDKSWVADCRGKVVKIISFLLQFLPDDSCYKVIFMRRDIREILASQNKMLVRRGEPQGAPDDEMVPIYEQHLRKVEAMLRERPNFDFLEVSHRRVLEAPEEQARRVVEFLDMPLDAATMAQVVDPRLYRNRAQAQGVAER